MIVGNFQLAGNPERRATATGSVPAARKPERQQREKTACHPGQGADHENQGEKALPQILEPHPRCLDQRVQPWPEDNNARLTASGSLSITRRRVAAGPLTRRVPCSHFR